MTKEMAYEMMSKVRKNLMTGNEWDVSVCNPTEEDFEDCYQVWIEIESFGISFLEFKKIMNAIGINYNSYYKGEFIAIRIFGRVETMNILMM